MKISAVVLTKNEEKNIDRCLKSLTFCDEIIVVDDYSSDNTLNQISKIKYQNDKSNIKIYKKNLNGNFASQRNFGLNKAAGEFVLFVDADEQLTPELQKSILYILQFNSLKYNAYYIKRRDFWWGKELRFGEIRAVRDIGIVRLVKKDCGLWMGNVHELFHTAKSVGSLNGFLNHFPHPKAADFLRDINLYSMLRAKQLFNRGKKTNIFEIIFFPLGKFILNYFIYLGFLDGPAGFAYAFFMSFHSFLVRVKLYQYCLWL